MALHPRLPESVLETERIHRRSQHSHVICGDAVHSSFRTGKSAPDISGSDDQRNLHAHLQSLFDSRHHIRHGVLRETVFLFPLQSLAADLEKHPFIKKFRFRHNNTFPFFIRVKYNTKSNSQSGETKNQRFYRTGNGTAGYLCRIRDQRKNKSRYLHESANSTLLQQKITF